MAMMSADPLVILVSVVILIFVASRFFQSMTRPSTGMPGMRNKTETADLSWHDGPSHFVFLVGILVVVWWLCIRSSSGSSSGTSGSRRAPVDVEEIRRKRIEALDRSSSASPKEPSLPIASEGGATQSHSGIATALPSGQQELRCSARPRGYGKNVPPQAPLALGLPGNLGSQATPSIEAAPQPPSLSNDQHDRTTQSRDVCATCGAIFIHDTEFCRVCKTRRPALLRCRNLRRILTSSASTQGAVGLDEASCGSPVSHAVSSTLQSSATTPLPSEVGTASLENASANSDKDVSKEPEREQAASFAEGAAIPESTSANSGVDVSKGAKKVQAASGAEEVPKDTVMPFSIRALGTIPRKGANSEAKTLDDITNATTVLDLQARISEAFGTGNDVKQRLFYMGRELKQAEARLGTIGLKAGSTVQVMFTLANVGGTQ